MTQTDNKATRLRTGRYVTQITGYRAFIPNPLPPNPPIKMDEEMINVLSQANLALGRLDGASDLLPNPDLFVGMYVQKEAVLSSQIEGTQASLIDLLAFEADAAEPTNPQDIAEVVNYVDALNYGLQRLDTLPLSLRLIREIHERLMAGVRGAEKQPGQFRTSQNWIGRPGSTIETASFVPPPPTEMHTALSNIETFMHTQEPMPALIKIGLVHSQFETVHPFLDGNGRMGRLLITFYLCQQHVLRRPLLYLSHYFKLNKLEYYEQLQRVRDEGDWESWLRYFLTGVREVAEQATHTARNIVHLREEHRELIAARSLRASGAASQLLEHLYRRPIITVKGVAEVTGQSYANANQLVAKFQDWGILHEMTQQARNRRFIYRQYLQELVPDEVGSAVSEPAEVERTQTTP
jgi:Fic family protein